MRWWHGLVVGLVGTGCAPTDDGTVDDADDVTDDTDVVDTDDTDDTDVVDTDETDVEETDETDDDDTDLPYSWPADVDDYVFEAATYLSLFDLPPAVGANACCRDWGAISKNGAGKIDNALGSLAAGLDFIIDMEAELDATIEAGSFVALLDHRDLPVSGTGEYTLGFFLGDFEGSTDHALAAAGDGTFTCDPASFVGSTGTPQVVYPDAELVDGHLLAADGDFSIALALVGINLVVPVSDVTLEADVLADSEGVWLSDGTLSGYIEIDDFFGAYNDVVDAACGCAGLAGPLFTQGAGGAWTDRCKTNNAVASACTQPGEEICVMLVGNSVLADPPGVCGALGALFPNVADIDTNGTPASYEALSIGLEFTGVPADVVGLTSP